MKQTNKNTKDNIDYEDEQRALINNLMTARSTEAIKQDKLREKYDVECRSRGVILDDFAVYKLYKHKDKIEEFYTAGIWFVNGLLIATVIFLGAYL